MCKRIHLLKYCTGCGPTDEWAVEKEQKCGCNTSIPEDVYRQPHPYMTFRCDECEKNENSFENSAIGKAWFKQYGVNLKADETKGKKAAKKMVKKKQPKQRPEWNTDI
ncbi:hypothetical protein SUNI508_04484 [Seiridium unicorne]|uniref:Uncharacterized protein n=1 Tax=Seiridium unicorne TaxID=138068 RepID=A0ABR2V8D8_9PEZI